MPIEVKQMVIQSNVSSNASSSETATSDKRRSCDQSNTLLSSHQSENSSKFKALHHKVHTDIRER
ncbi:DUF5908 family protein [Celerinatantimonas yamalensis]|uniref:DUF5908 family protein n=1 Tax=Celerinatantimonas yamalensis TaxID=559956 RepID=A0ABW9G1T3_9GAMM